MILEIEIFDKYGDDHEAQAKYLVRGHNDVYWTDDIDHALSYLKNSLEELEESVA